MKLILFTLLAFAGGFTLQAQTTHQIEERAHHDAKQFIITHTMDDFDAVVRFGNIRDADGRAIEGPLDHAIELYPNQPHRIEVYRKTFYGDICDKYYEHRTLLPRQDH
jgi:hypothetical protein